jgi:hypothetical protein
MRTSRTFFDLEVKEKDFTFVIPYNTAEILKKGGVIYSNSEDLKRFEFYYAAIEKENKITPFPALQKDQMLYFILRPNSNFLKNKLIEAKGSVHFFEINKNTLMDKVNTININSKNEIRVWPRLGLFKDSKINFGKFQDIEIQNIKQQKLLQKSIKLDEQDLRWSFDLDRYADGIYDLVMTKPVSDRKRFFLDKEKELLQNDILLSVVYDNNNLKYSNTTDLKAEKKTTYSITIDLEKIGLENINK